MTHPPTPTPLTHLLQVGVKNSLLELASDHPGDPVAGYALCTDDELSTLFWVATTHRHIATVSDTKLKFSAVEWPHGHSSDALRAAQDMLAEQHRSALARGALEEHVFESFAALVEALTHARTQGLIPPSALVYAASTDPSPRLDDLERQCVVHLNPPDVVRLWEQNW